MYQYQDLSGSGDVHPLFSFDQLIITPDGGAECQVLVECVDFDAQCQGVALQQHKTIKRVWVKAQGLKWCYTHGMIQQTAQRLIKWMFTAESVFTAKFTREDYVQYLRTLSPSKYGQVHTVNMDMD